MFSLFVDPLAMLSTATIAVSIEWSWLLFVWAACEVCVPMMMTTLFH
jgi:hypothetical protein